MPEPRDRADLDLRLVSRPCPSCAGATPRLEPTCGACGVQQADHEEMVALVEGVEGAAELLGWTTDEDADLEYHPGAILDHEGEFRASAEALGVDLATAAFHWAEALVDADWIERARRGAAPDTPAARTLGRTASELSERAIRDAEAAEARVRRVRAALWIVSLSALSGLVYGLVRLLT